MQTYRAIRGLLARITQCRFAEVRDRVFIRPTNSRWVFLILNAARLSAARYFHKRLLKHMPRADRSCHIFIRNPTLRLFFRTLITVGSGLSVGDAVVRNDRLQKKQRIKKRKKEIHRHAFSNAVAAAVALFCFRNFRSVASLFPAQEYRLDKCSVARFSVSTLWS